MKVCKICGDECVAGAMGLVHKSTGSMYVCAHRKRVEDCCGKDDHCVAPMSPEDRVRHSIRPRAVK